MMKVLTLILSASLLLLGSCMNTYVSSSDRRLVDIPTVAHDRSVDIYLQSELPKKEYIKIEILETKGVETQSTSEMIYFLGQEASRRGYDGLILMDEKLSTIVEDDEGFLETITEMISGEEIPDNIYSTTYRHMSAVGIIYRDNLHYLNKVPKAEQLLDPYGNLIASVKLDYKGQPEFDSESISRNERLYLTNLYYYSQTHLLDEQSDHWKYTMEGNLISKRSFIQRNTRNKVVTFGYDKSHRIKKAIIKNTYPQKYTEKVEFTYGDNGRLVQQEIVSDHRTRIINYHYGHDRLLSKQVWQLEEDDKKLLYQTSVIHYDNKDIDSLVQLVSASKD